MIFTTSSRFIVKARRADVKTCSPRRLLDKQHEGTYNCIMNTMTIEQTVKIPANGWVHLDLPPELAGTSGKVVVIAPVAPVEAESAPRRLTAQDVLERGLGFGSGPRMDPHEALEMACGIAKGSGFTSERLFEERRRDSELDEEQYRRLFHKDGGTD
jgi:hypothetical protein